MDQGEWLAYKNLQIPSTGNYKVHMRVSSPSGATVSVDLNGVQCIGSSRHPQYRPLAGRNG
ncbi:carbohydrate-binding protein [Microbulbifer sp. ANSA001]|uniref:carbohydrate-binding protein n=1 Tax=unclassified Microbulbifer TaxID=2619833 RepID=UPI0033420E38